MTVSYRNFDLLIERHKSAYCARVLSSPEGEASAEFTFPFSSLELENFVLRVGQSRRGVRRVESPQMQAAKAFGIRLCEAVFSGQVRDLYQAALRSAEREGFGLRLLLRLSDVPELINVPWEYLYEPSLARFLALSVDTPVVRYMDIPRQILPLNVQAPLRVLTMISSPREFPPLDVEAEWNILNDALSDLIQRGQVSLTRLEKPTLLALQEQLRQEEFHVFHYIGHGTFSDYKEDGLLLLEDEQGAGSPISGHYLGTLLHDEKSLRLVVLNACEGARTSTSDPYAGAAQQLVRQGIPAVIAMQFEIGERTAETLSREFYRSLVDNYPVDAALAEARKAIYTQGQDIEWGIPVLYMRSPDGHLFDVEPAAGGQAVSPPLQDSAQTPAKPESGGINVSIGGDVSGQVAIGNNIAQHSNLEHETQKQSMSAKAEKITISPRKEKSSTKDWRYAYLEIYNGENYDLRDCFATLESLKIFVEPDNDYIDWTEQIQGNTLHLTWPAYKSEQEKIVRRKKKARINIAKMVGDGFPLLIFADGREERIPSNLIYFKISLNAEINGIPITEIEYQGFLKKTRESFMRGEMIVRTTDIDDTREEVIPPKHQTVIDLFIETGNLID